MNAKNILRTVNMVLAIGLISYAVVYGLSKTLPWQNANLSQTSRNVFYHVPMWFAMMVMGYTSVVYSVLFLRKAKPHHDLLARESAKLTVVFGFLGLLTGAIWSRVTWGEALPATDPAAWWPWDPKQTSALICVLIYMGYFLLRSSFEDELQKAKISGVFNIFAAASIYPLFYVIPKVMGGLHPNTGDQGSALVDMSAEFYSVFWPSVLGFICLAIWIFDYMSRKAIVEHRLNQLQYDE